MMDSLLLPPKYSVTVSLGDNTHSLPMLRLEKKRTLTL